MYNKILVATDGSPGAKRAEDHAIDLVKKFGAQLTALHVVDLAHWTMFLTPVIVRDTEHKSMVRNAIIQDLWQKGEKILAVVKEKAEKAGITIETKIRKGSPWEEIVKETKVNKYNLLIIGPVSHKPLFGAPLGTVAERVVQYARCPVLIAKPTLEAIEKPKVIPQPISAAMPTKD